MEAILKVALQPLRIGRELARSGDHLLHPDSLHLFAGDAGVLDPMVHDLPVIRIGIGDGWGGARAYAAVDRHQARVASGITVHRGYESSELDARVREANGDQHDLAV